MSDEERAERSTVFGTAVSDSLPVGDGEHDGEVLIDQPASEPKTERAERCETCRAWNPVVSNQGQCRKRAPVASGNSVAVWPWTLDGYWCEEWKPKTGPVKRLPLITRFPSHELRGKCPRCGSENITHSDKIDYCYDCKAWLGHHREPTGSEQ